MANTKKTVTGKNTAENKIGNIAGIKRENGVLSLFDLSKIVNAVVDSVFIERDGRLEFAAELYEVLLAYMKIGAFYPQTGVFENSLDLFFIDYIDNKYHKETSELEFNPLAKYIDNAVKHKVDARMRQIENPLINSLVKFVDIASALSQKYVDDIDNVGTSDIKGFIRDFAELAKQTNPQTVTDAVIKLHKAENGNAETSVEKTKSAPKKQGSRVKKTAE